MLYTGSTPVCHLRDLMAFNSQAPSTTNLSIPLHEFLKKDLIMDEASEMRLTELTQWMSDGLGLHTLT